MAPRKAVPKKRTTSGKTARAGASRKRSASVTPDAKRKATPAKRAPAKKAAAKKKPMIKSRLLAHPATAAMVARINGCGKPPILWERLADGSYLECFLKSDCTYGNCVPVEASQVPPEYR